MGLDWEKARRLDKLKQEKPLPRSRKRATDKQRDFINNLLRQLGYDGAERQRIWNTIQNPVDASVWISELLKRRRDKRAA